MSPPASTPHGSKSARVMDNGVDRLSNLPDELLHCVMSFLPMPETVRTSVLSARWHNLWASTPYIHIDHQDFMNHQKLEKFGYHLLLLRDNTTSLDEVRISSPDVNSIACCEWIRHAIMHKVRLLHVSGTVLLDSTAMISSQHLRTVRLQSNLLRHGFFRPLNCDCPVLEHLELENCGLWDLKEISSRSLKVLRIIGCHIFDGLVICASNLTHVSIVDPSFDPDAIVTRDLSSLLTASVSLTSTRFHYYKRNAIADHRLLDGLSHATTLELHAPLPEVSFERSLRTCPMFSNLTSLVLGEWCMAADFYPLLRILQRSCKLKELKLELTMEEFSTCKDSEPALSSTRGAPPPPPGSGGHPCIERVKIYCHEDDPRVSSLLQALQPVVGDVKIIIEHH